MAINWHEVPLLRLVLPFIVGILFAIYTSWQPSVGVLIAGLLLITGALFYLNSARNRWQLRWLYGLTVSVFMVWLGWQLTQLHDELRQANHFQTALAERNVVVGEIYKIEPTSTGKARVQLQIEAIGVPDTPLQTAHGNLLAYLDSTALEQLNYGDRISLLANINRIEQPKNPKAFDYARYMHFKNVHHQAFVWGNDWQLLEPADRYNLLVIADRLRDRCIGILKKHFPTENELAVASALILGYRGEITDEVRNAYANTGAMHVLAVSGLHVGFIYLGISFLLGLVRTKWRHWKLAKTLLEIAAIWSFAVLTGASPSVLRASTMFSFIIFGGYIQGYTNIYNTLAASAFFLLCWNPYFLMDVGFQLSYLAVLGIVYFQPKIYKLLYIKHKIGDYAWKLVAVSLAAQISTLPISLYYFHQFPMYFWLSGLVVVPVAVVILCGGFLLFITNAIPGWSWLLGKALWGIVALVNKAIFLIQQIPGSTLKGIWIGFGTVLLLYALIMMVVLAMESRQFKWLVAGLGFLAVVGLMRAITQWQVLQQRELVVYNISRHSAIDFFDGRKMVSINDAEERSLTFAAQNQRWSRRVREVEQLPMPNGLAVYRFGQVQMAVVDGEFDSNFNKKIPVDYVLIRGNPWGTLTELLEPFDCQRVIFDASNYPGNIAKWRAEAEKLGLEIEDVQTNGAFQLSMQ